MSVGDEDVYLVLAILNGVFVLIFSSAAGEVVCRVWGICSWCSDGGGVDGGVGVRVRSRCCGLGDGVFAAAGRLARGLGVCESGLKGKVL